MTIDQGSLDRLVQSAFNRYGITSLQEQQAIQAELQAGGSLRAMINALDQKSAGAPTTKQPGAHAIFYSGWTENGAAWQFAEAISSKSSGQKYFISDTVAGAYINNEANYAGVYTALGPISDDLRKAIHQIIDGVASYNYAMAAPINSDVIWGGSGTGVDRNSIILSVEIPTFSAKYPTGTWNGVQVSSLVQYNPNNPQLALDSANASLSAAMAYWNIASNGTYITTNIYGSTVNGQSGGYLTVATSNNSINVSMDAVAQVTGSNNTIIAGNNSIVKLVSGNFADTVYQNYGTLNVDSNAGGWGTNALKLIGSNNTVTTGAVDVLLLQGNSNNITAGDSSYIGVLTGSNSTNITMPHGTVYVGAGANVTAQGNDITFQLSTLNEYEHITVTTSYRVNMVEVNFDNTRQEVSFYVSSAVSSFKRINKSYLSDGRQIGEAIQAWDGSFAVRYFNYTNTSTGTGWGETYIIFDTNGKAVQQVTNDRDGSVYVTVFANSANRPMNVTYVYTTTAAANAALSANDWKIQELVASNGSQAYWSGANALIAAYNAGEPGVVGATWAQLPSFSTTGGALSGVSQIQWTQGLQITVNFLTMRPTLLLGNNQTTWNQVGADAGQLSNSIIDPLVLNLKGGAVDTTAMGENGVSFDMLGDGLARETGWISAGEAFVVNGLQAPTNGSGFTTVEQFSLLDVDHNGVVTAAEASSLGIWQPSPTGNGGSVSTLQQLGIASINLDWQALWAPQAGVFTPMGRVDHGNLISSAFTFTYVDGSVGQGADVSFGVRGDAHIEAAAQGLIQAAAGFGAVDGGAMSSIVAAWQTGALPGSMALPQSWQS